MTPYGDYENEFEEERDETPEETTERLRAEWASGEDEVRPELADSLMQQAQQAMEREEFDDARRFADEAIEIAGELIEEGQHEFLGAVGRCMLFRSALDRFRKSEQDGLVSFNETIRFLAENIRTDSMAGHNELAIALMNKADLLIDPLGAHSAAVASQGQAAKIWKRLIEDGQTEFRLQYASALLALGETKRQTGDLASGLDDVRQAVSEIREGIDTDETELNPLLIQALLKLTKIHEQIGNIPEAFEASGESIAILESAVEAGNELAEPALTTLYFQQGSLYERIGNPEAALTEYDRCRDVYLRMLRRDDLEAPGDYIARTGLANVLMCRGNMLADLGRFDEASDSFEESVDLYRQSEEFRPKNDEDETFLPYSIGVVRLNHANMLAAREQYPEAIRFKEDAIAALQRRLEADHPEILPNLVSAYRKMIGIRRMLGETEQMFRDIARLVEMLEKAVDEGALEYRSDLAATYHLRALCKDEAGEPEFAEQDFYRALRLYRDDADEEIGKPEVQWAKLQWGEILVQYAKHFIRLGRFDDALLVFRREIDDAYRLYADGNVQLVFDILFGYSQFVEFVDGFLRDEDETKDHDVIRRFAQIALDAARSGIELSRRHRVDVRDEIPLDLFFRMKIAFFHRHAASFHFFLQENDSADKEFEYAAAEWEKLVEDADRLRLKKQFFDEEAESAKPSDLPDSLDSSDSADSVNSSGHAGVRNSTSPRKTEISDPLYDKWKYFVSEWRQTLYHWAMACMSAERSDRARELFQTNVDLSRDLVRRGIPHSDRFLVLSLTTYATAAETLEDFPTATSLYDEAARCIRKQLEEGEQSESEWGMFRHVFMAYAKRLHTDGQIGKAENLMKDYVLLLKGCRNFPSPGLWVELCRTLDVRLLWRKSAGPAVQKLRQSLFALHPRYGKAEEFRRQEENETSIDDPSNPKARSPETPESSS